MLDFRTRLKYVQEAVQAEEAQFTLQKCVKKLKIFDFDKKSTLAALLAEFGWCSYIFLCSLVFFSTYSTFVVVVVLIGVYVTNRGRAEGVHEKIEKNQNIKLQKTYRYKTQKTITFITKFEYKTTTKLHKSNYHH